MVNHAVRSAAAVDEASTRSRYLRMLATGSSLERTLAFSDAVFAIAMTILVLELRVPDVESVELAAALLTLLPVYLTFLLSFVVVGMVWLSHHRKFLVIVRFDQGLLRLNLVVLLLVASLGLPTAALGRFGDTTLAVVLYSGFISALGFMMVLLWVYARRRGLLDERVDAALYRYVLVQSLIIPCVFLVSIPIAVVAGALAGEMTWAAAVPLSVVVARWPRHRPVGSDRRQP